MIFFQVQAKEFVLPNSAKETPIVSANCDAVEVTLPNKSPKDRESPVKSRKQREQVVKEHKETVKEHASSKEGDKQPIVPKDSEVKPKEVVASIVATNVPQAPVPVKESMNQEKKSQKKEGKADPKAPSPDSCESVPSTPAPVQAVPVVQDVSNNGECLLYIIGSGIFEFCIKNGLKVCEGVGSLLQLIEGKYKKSIIKLLFFY